ncbi:PREDICTED: uncharacterized protein LOC105570867 [Vollenhovia emeryi]|uniref:uncharacterized protein LOC105570867 n=1 Tax=Vollenhovia emeryi TaxID=411798 RepID=UPI0005F3BD81|nr:PREDICTED: uncharacterized protein LOC105570867 [Vollenhovia emeryi]
MAKAPITTFTIEPFDTALGLFSRWLMRLEGAFKIFSITEEARVPYLLHYVGAVAFNILSDRLSPQNPQDTGYDELTRILKEFYDPVTLEIAEVYKLHQRKQEEGETAQEYSAALHRIALKCNFGTFIKTAIRNVFVCGLRNRKAQGRLLEMRDLSLHPAVQTAATIELSERGTKNLQGEVGVAQVQTTQKPGGNDGSGRAKAKSKKNVKSRVNNSSNITCYRCGKNYLASRCTLDRSVKCFSCGKTGHLRKVCRSDKQSSNCVDVLAVEYVQYRDKLLTSLIVNEKRVRFEIDSGAAVSSISQCLAKRLFPKEKLHKTVLHLISYCKKPIDLLGYLVVRVKCRGKTRELNLYVTTGDREPLLGREWILQLKDHGDMHQLLGRLQSIHVIEDPSLQTRLVLKDNAKPVFVKAWQIPFRLRALVEQELDRLESEGILEKVDSSEWATPIVPVLKKNGQAYLQLEVRPEDQTFLTLSTHKGLYRATRLMYGVASAPAIWQRTIENILKDIPGVVVFLDDIRVAGTNRQDHLNKLRLVFSRLQKYNIRVNMEKSEFFMSQIQYCGYVIDKDGLHKAPEKMEAIHNMKRPTNVTEWTSQCEKSFKDAKKAFISPKCLVHFDPRLPVTLATDASSYGVRAVLSHIYPDGSERAIQYASQTLSSAQRNYSQIDKEAYAIIYGVKKFHQYLQGSKFTLITDHRPLTQIFSPTKSLPIYTALRMQHYSLFLQGFNYDIKYRKSELHSNADCLSRLPIPRNSDVQDPVDVFQLSTFDTLPITAQEVATATATDKELSKLLQILKSDSTPFSFEEGRRVSCHNYAGNDKWLFGTVTRRLGTLHYEVQLDDGRTWKRHVNQMRLIGTPTPIKFNDYGLRKAGYSYYKYGLVKARFFEFFFCVPVWDISDFDAVTVARGLGDFNFRDSENFETCTYQETAVASQRLCGL